MFADNDAIDENDKSYKESHSEEYKDWIEFNTQCPTNPYFLIKDLM
jgi:hypothetical protein